MNRCWLLALLALPACTGVTIEGRETLRSAYPIVSVDAESITPVRALNLSPGRHQVEVVFQSYRYNYHCHFDWQLGEGEFYEISYRHHEDPLTLFRWKRQNALWSLRLDAKAPEHCQRKASSALK